MYKMTAVLLAAVLPALANAYCLPTDDCWPEAAAWDALGAALPTGSLDRVGPPERAYLPCYLPGTDAYGIAAAANGICMQAHDCARQFCDYAFGFDLPEYVVGARTEGDIKAVLAFATEHDIAVTVKTSGHSYSGSSSGYGTILISMRDFEKISAVEQGFVDSCGAETGNTLRVGGGETWFDAYSAVGSDFHIVGGGGLSVAAAGGWMQGGGLSAMSRKYGFGIDNLLRVTAVLANGTTVVADECSNTDLFWALRGGGGGTFGVVTEAVYRLHPVEPVTVIFMSAVYTNDATFFAIVDSWIDFWVDQSPHFSCNLSGYWSLSLGILYYMGDPDSAEFREIEARFDAWLDSLPFGQRLLVVYDVSTSDSYWDSRGRGDSTDETGQLALSIASRLVSRDWVVEDPTRAKDVLRHMSRNGFSTFSYFLGCMSTQGSGAMSQSFRDALWQIEPVGEQPTSEYLAQYLRDVIPDTGSGFNHGSKNEPDWRAAFWGQDKYDRLASLKEDVDPEHRFNCWHCVGYIGNEAPEPPRRNSDGSVATQPVVAARIVEGSCNEGGGAGDVVVEVQVRGAGEGVLLVGDRGQSVVPRGRPCAYFTVGIANPRVVVAPRGTTSVGPVPAAAVCGKQVQLVDTDECHFSEVVEIAVDDE